MSRRGGERTLVRRPVTVRSAQDSVIPTSHFVPEAALRETARRVRMRRGPVAACELICSPDTGSLDVGVVDGAISGWMRNGGQLAGNLSGSARQ